MFRTPAMTLFIDSGERRGAEAEAEVVEKS